MVVIHGFGCRIYDPGNHHARPIFLVAISPYWVRYGLQLAHDPVVVFHTYRMVPEIHHPEIWRTQALY